MQAQVPQYIEVEDKVIGPLTIRQFMYLIVGLGIIGLLWVLFKPVIVFLLAPLIIAFFGAAAFYKVNGRPFLSYVAAFIKLSATPTRYTWQHGKEKTKTIVRETKELGIPKKGAIRRSCPDTCSSDSTHHKLSFPRHHAG